MRTLVVAPHPDDEILGVGGTLLRRKAEGAQVAWLIVTGISTDAGWSASKVAERAAEIARVTQIMGFDEVFSLGFPTSRLDTVSMSDLVAAMSVVFKAFEPNEVFVPDPNDAHSDHQTVFNAATACTKWFRYPSVRRVLTYETISETDAGVGTAGFTPNHFVNITAHLDRKIEIMSVFASEMGSFPFPRSPEAIRAQAMVRGAASGFEAAEAFRILRDRV